MKQTRRLSALRLVLLALALAWSSAAVAKDLWVYFGTYTGKSSKGIYASRLDASTGKLTPTEFSIFQYLAERRGSWVSSDKIINDVIGSHHAPRTALVRVHVHHIRRKLADCGWCLRAEHGRGYMLSV